MSVAYSKEGFESPVVHMRIKAVISSLAFVFFLLFTMAAVNSPATASQYGDVKYCLAHAIPTVTTETCYDSQDKIVNALGNNVLDGIFYVDTQNGGDQLWFWSSNDCSGQIHLVDDLSRLPIPNPAPGNGPFTWNNVISSGIVGHQFGYGCTYASIWGGVNQSGDSHVRFNGNRVDFRDFNPNMNDLTTSIEFSN